MADKLIGSEAIELVAQLLACWPNANDDSKGYIGALAAMLREYPRCVAIKCADPAKGLAKETKFRPSVADVAAWCDRELEGLRKIVDRDDQEQRWAKERAEAADRERARLAQFKSPAGGERVKAKLAETLEALGAALGRKTAAEQRAEAEETLARCAFEAGLPSTLSVSKELAKMLNPASALCGND